jgi:hypothetical protein
MEIWKPIKDYDDLYEVSNKGRIKSLIDFKFGRIIKRELILKNHTDIKGYLYCSLSKERKLKHHKVHRLVALNFIPNLENKPQVNHKDGNKKNNKIENLEWCTAKENVQHAFKTKLRIIQKGKNNPMCGRFGKDSNKSISVIMCDKRTNNELLTFDSMACAARWLKNNTKYKKATRSNISSCCKGIKKSIYGYKWKYKEVQ